MNNNRAYRIIAVVALMLGVVGVTLGYSAFSSNLTISSSAEVKPEGSKFNVDFSSSSSSVQTENIVPSLSTTATGFTATDAEIDNDGDPVITNLKATFTEPGQSVQYSFYAYNLGEYVAYLNSISFIGSKSCTAKTGTDQTLVDSACNGISLSIKVGNEEVTTASVNSITNHTLGVNSAEPIIVTISYASGSAIADGDFDVTLPSIKLTYESAD